MVDIKLIHGFFVNNAPNGRTARVLTAVVFCSNHGFNFIFHGVWQLVPGLREELNAVVLKRIVRSGNYRTGIGMQFGS